MTDLMESRLPLSPVFLDFLSRWLDKQGFQNERWPDQLSESLFNSRAKMSKRARMRLERVMTDDAGQSAIERVYRLFHDFMMGRTEDLSVLHRELRFIAVVGCPRTGGSYMTAELFSALRYDPTSVPAAIAHDGFPDAQPIVAARGRNAWMGTLLSLSEYLAIVEIFFSLPTCSAGLTYVPKKLTKSVYAGSLFNTALGEAAEFLITIRHPIACCISTYDKSGGLPANGRFLARSTIEKWVRRDLLWTGVSSEELSQMDYFSAYARYWEQFYMNLALSGLVTGRECRVVPFLQRTVEDAVEQFHRRHASARTPSQFVSSTRWDRKHPEWVARSEEAMHRVAAVWRLVGLAFPSEDLEQCA